MLVTLSTRLTVDQRDELFVLAQSLDTSPAGLIRDILCRYLESGSNPPSQTEDLIVDTSDDVTRALVLLRFIADRIDPQESQRLMDETDAFLAEESDGVGEQSIALDALLASSNGVVEHGREAHHG